MMGNFVASMDSKTGVFKKHSIDKGTHSHSLVVDSKGRPCFDLFGTNGIGTIDPKTGTLRTYTLPNDRARPRRIEITDDHTIWYGDYTRGFLGKLNTETGAVEEFLMPEGAGSMPYGMAADDRGFIWVAETGVQPNRLVSFDPRAKKLIENVPIASDAVNTIRHMQFDRATRLIWFADDANQIARVKVAPIAVVP